MFKHVTKMPLDEYRAAIRRVAPYVSELNQVEAQMFADYILHRDVVRFVKRQQRCSDLFLVVISELASHINQYFNLNVLIFIFGSRVKLTSRRSSDLDVTVLGDGCYPEALNLFEETLSCAIADAFSVNRNNVHSMLVHTVGDQSSTASTGGDVVLLTDGSGELRYGLYSNTSDEYCRQFKAPHTVDYLRNYLLSKAKENPLSDFLYFFRKCYVNSPELELQYRRMFDDVCRACEREFETRQHTGLNVADKLRQQVRSLVQEASSISTYSDLKFACKHVLNTYCNIAAFSYLSADQHAQDLSRLSVYDLINGGAGILCSVADVVRFVAYTDVVSSLCVSQGQPFSTHNYNRLADSSDVDPCDIDAFPVGETRTELLSRSRELLRLVEWL